MCNTVNFAETSQKTQKTAISMDGVTFRFKNREREVLKNVSFSLKRGKCMVITGSSASGKSTLCQCLNGLVPQALEGDLLGSIRILGKDPQRFRVQTMSREIGLVMQDPEVQIVGRTVYEDLAFGLRNYLFPANEIDSRITKALTQVGLKGFETRETSVLSGGEKQRLAMASILAITPQVMVLDEPASELDPAGRKSLFELLEKLKRQEGITLVIVDKKPQDLISLLDTLLVLKKGRVISYGPPEQACTFGQPGISTAPIVTRKEKNFTNQASHQELLNVKQLTFGYSHKDSILKEINLKLYQNDFLALVGHNGVGKTSLAKHLNGLVKPPKNTVFFQGSDITSMNARVRSRSVGYVFQNPDHQLFESSVEREIAYGLKLNGVLRGKRIKIIKEMLAVTGLEPFRHHHPYTLGKGERQLVCIASMAALRPKVLVVDEPTTGLDQEGIEKVMNILDRLFIKGTAIVLISHDMDLVKQYTNRVIVMAQGKIICDNRTEKVFAQSAILKQAGLASME